MTHKMAMRRTLAEEGSRSRRSPRVRTLAEGARRSRRSGCPAVLEARRLGRPARRSSGSSRPDDLEAHLHAALVESPAREAILEGFVDGIEMNGIVIARDGDGRAR